MALKQIPFSLEMVKKIQAGEIKGCIKTRDGKTARFLGEIKDNIYPLVFAKETENSEEELLDVYTLTGKYSIAYDSSELNIILEIEEEQQEYQFKAFDKVLVRDKENGYRIWQAAFYSHFYIGRDNGYHVTTAGDLYLDGGIIPYAGNENLLGTTDKPKEE